MMSLTGSEIGMGVIVGPAVDHSWFDFFAANYGSWCGSIGGGGIGDNVGRKGVADAGW